MKKKQLNNEHKIHMKKQEQHPLRVPTDVFMFNEHNHLTVQYCP